VNRTRRLIKSPRRFGSDTGLALHLGGTGPTGAQLDNLVMHDLIARRDASIDRVELADWRTRLRSPSHLPQGIRSQGARAGSPGASLRCHGAFKNAP